MKVHDPHCDRHAQAVVLANNTEDLCEEYEHWIDDDGAHCTFLALPPQTAPNITFQYGVYGKLGDVTVDLVVDGVLRNSKIWHLNAQKVYKRESDFRWGYWLDDRQVIKGEFDYKRLESGLSRNESGKAGTVEFYFSVGNSDDSSASYHPMMASNESWHWGSSKVDMSLSSTSIIDPDYCTKLGTELRRPLPLVTEARTLDAMRELRPGARPWAVIRYTLLSAVSVERYGLEESSGESHALVSSAPLGSDGAQITQAVNQNASHPGPLPRPSSPLSSEVQHNLQTASPSIPTSQKISNDVNQVTDSQQSGRESPSEKTRGTPCPRMSPEMSRGGSRLSDPADLPQATVSGIRNEIARGRDQDTAVLSTPQSLPPRQDFIAANHALDNARDMLSSEDARITELENNIARVKHTVEERESKILQTKRALAERDEMLEKVRAKKQRRAALEKEDADWDRVSKEKEEQERVLQAELQKPHKEHDDD